jgi:hypothetical protein
MNSIVKLRILRSGTTSIQGWVLQHILLPFGVAVAIGAGGCGYRDIVRVQLHSHAPINQGTPNLEITAQVAGTQSGLRYQWFSVAGGCSPQKSESPTTTFRFADGTMHDRVSVQVWRGDKLVGRSEIDVKLDELQARLVTDDPPAEVVHLEITNVPPYEPKGGAETHGEISGTVSGNLVPGCSVVLYARASEMWYIQPIAYAAHAIRPDNTWSTWTHTGSSYAALVVRPGFEPVPRLDVLPKVGGYVVARAIVEGAKK